MGGKQRERAIAAAASGLLGVSLFVAGDVVVPFQEAAAAAPTREPALTVEARRDVVRVRQRGRYVYPRLGVKALAEESPFEVWAERSSYRDPIATTRVIRHGSGRQHQRLPDGSVGNRWRGLEDFARLVVRRPGGRKVIDRTLGFCPRSARRTEATAPRSPYPRWCGGMRWTLGMVWGVQAGWEAPLADHVALRLPVGRYRVRVVITGAYRDALGIPVRKAAAAVTLVVRKREDTATAERPQRARRGAASMTQPAAEPTEPGKVPGERYRPDLQALPAWDIGTRAGKVRDLLTFSANVWNAGPAPLVVDGFRDEGEANMDAYQNFYDDNRDQVGAVRTGEMEWDDRRGHGHWHFTDFAGYRLLAADGQQAVRSHKQSFCIVPTHAIDYTVDNADWRPGSGDLHTMCGWSASDRSLRQVMQVGSGDTYDQWRAGQAFNITNVPNGTYFVEIRANPAGRLYESDTRNNVSLRKVRLGGERGRRTVKVFPYRS